MSLWSLFFLHGIPLKWKSIFPLQINLISIKTGEEFSLNKEKKKTLYSKLIYTQTMENTWSKDRYLEKVFLSIKYKNPPREGGMSVFGSFFLPRGQIVMSLLLRTNWKGLIFLFACLFIFLNYVNHLFCQVEFKYQMLSWKVE